MLQLYDYPASANCLKVRLLLRHLEIEWERLPVDLFAGETKTHDYLALNPAGRTPVLVTEGGEALPESGAILLYLAEGTPFLPQEGARPTFGIERAASVSSAGSWRAPVRRA